MLMFY